MQLANPFPISGAPQAVAKDLHIDRIFELSADFNTSITAKIEQITSVNRTARMLSLNAMVVASRAGEAGKGFSLVAEEFKQLSTQIETSIKSLEMQAHIDLGILTTTSSAILERMQGQRLADLALNAIEIIDRNLYERTCDVRWWATDSAVVTCVQDPSDEASGYAARRLKIILDAYTVYLDLWVCDASGRVLANGRPDKYPAAKNLSVARESWFIDAMRLASGDEFAVAEIQVSEVLNSAPVATYATAIREGASAKGKAIGVLGIHFDWCPQAQAVVDGVRLSDEERKRTDVMILDQKHRVIASSNSNAVLGQTIEIKTDLGPSGNYADSHVMTGYARTPGYETYRGMGWYGCIRQTRSARSMSLIRQRAD